MTIITRWFAASKRIKELEAALRGAQSQMSQRWIRIEKLEDSLRKAEAGREELRKRIGDLESVNLQLTSRNGELIQMESLQAAKIKELEEQINRTARAELKIKYALDGLKKVQEELEIPY